MKAARAATPPPVRNPAPAPVKVTQVAPQPAAVKVEIPPAPLPKTDTAPQVLSEAEVNRRIAEQEQRRRQLEAAQKPATPAIVDVTATALPSTPATRADLRPAYRAFASGDLAASERLLTGILTVQSAPAEAYLLRGCARYTRAMLSRTPDPLLVAATDDFRAALQRNAALRLDRNAFSPKLVAFFEAGPRLALMDVAAAAARLAPYAPPTPLVRALLLSRDLGCDLWVKNETVSPIASFKWRGALNDLLREPATRGVVTSSTGNHGQGVAWAAGVAGVPAHIFLPLGANPTKRAKIDSSARQSMTSASISMPPRRPPSHSPARKVCASSTTARAKVSSKVRPRLASRSRVRWNGSMWSTSPWAAARLASGVAMAIREQHPHAHIVAVQSSGSPAMVESFHARRAIERPAETLADGLICRVPAQLALDQLIEFVDDAITVTDDELVAAARAMILGAHLLVEPSGAAGLAAAMRGDVRGKSVVVIATGANITPELLAKLTLGESRPSP